MSGNPKAARRAGERGYAMVVALLIIALLIAGGALMAQELMKGSRLLRGETSELHLQNVLDSAVSHMMAEYRYNPDFEGSDQVKVDGGEARIRAQRVGPDLRRLEITAAYRGLERRAVVGLYVNPAHPIRLVDYEFVVGGEAAFAGP